MRLHSHMHSGRSLWYHLANYSREMSGRNTQTPNGQKLTGLADEGYETQFGVRTTDAYLWAQ